MAKFLKKYLILPLALVFLMAFPACNALMDKVLELSYEDEAAAIRDYDGYAYNRLDDGGKYLYCVIKDAVINHVSELSNNNFRKYTPEQLFKAYEYLLADFPEAFWANGDSNAMSVEKDGVKSVTDFKIDYIYDKEQRDEIQLEIDKTVNAFLESVPPGASDYEKLLRAYEYIINSTLYDSDAEEKLGDEEYKALLNERNNIKSVFIDKTGVCGGYTKAFQYLAEKMGIYATAVTGKIAETDTGHAWNLVLLEGDYYYIDVTWGGTVIEGEDGYGALNYNYFCVTTEELLKTHIPDTSFELPVCAAAKYNYYVYNGLFFTEYNYTKISEAVISAVKNNKSEVDLKFAGKTAFDAAYKKLMDDKAIFDILASAGRYNKDLDVNKVNSIKNEKVNVLRIIFEMQK
ncbi:MAG: hypothetical protein FWF08_01335 [Oscillospiraceae bacterium]|nr:hypothetical protein [Oscillospiraceae bacterium]